MAEVTKEKLMAEAFQGLTENISDQIGLIWRLIREKLLVPIVKVAVWICLAMTVMVFIERVYMAIVVLLVKIFRRKPEKKYKWEPLPDDDIESGNACFPMVLIQIPMYNEKEVYKMSIDAACNLSWPSDRIVIQVLDDSTDPIVKGKVEKECRMWASKGVNIRYQIRNNRKGYKAGALAEGLKHDYIQHCEFFAIFDADFQPEPNFLRRTMPFLIHNPEIALVQARWKFVNADECLLTRMQEMSLDYHFKVEQESGSSAHAFFGFNGTGGVWRIAAINEAGGWKDRTTVEDMDLAVRVGLRGWKFLYLGDLQVKSELPSTFKAYRYQQHRWSCGPANLFRKMVMEIVTSKKVTLYKKIYVIYNFFFVRKIVAHLGTFFFFCIILPLSILIGVDVPLWGAIYIPCIITTLNAVGTPRSFHLLYYWVLFENVMALHRTKGTFIGLFEAKRSNEWVVTEKLGDALKNKSIAKEPPKAARLNFVDRIHTRELGSAVFLFVCGCYDIFYGKRIYFIYVFLQAIAFTIVGFGYVGTIV